MKVIVLGAGILGVASAWFLGKAGHEVTVLERQPGAGLETSFANGGQISVSHAEPWANPHAPMKVLKWLGQEDAPLLFRLRLDWQQWRWGAQFLRECTAARTRANIIQILAMSTYSREVLRELRGETGIQYDHLARGILHFYTDRADFERVAHAADLMRQYGCDRHMKSADECVQIEPALAACRDKLVGGTYTPEDESGDAYKFTHNLAALAAAKGARFRYGVTAETLEREGDAISAVRIKNETGAVERISADACVVCLGSYTPKLVEPLGVPALLYPVKGYSITMNIEHHHGAPTVSLTDDEAKLVFSRLGNRLRVAGTAELNGYNTELNPVRCEAIVMRAFQLFPDAGERSKVKYWTGLRPATPGNVPLVGRTRYRNLFLNTGHGTLGWTMGCGSGKAIADIVSGRKPEVDFAFLRAV